MKIREGEAMNGFDKYWGTRIEANEVFLNQNQHIANWMCSEARLAYETGQECGDSFKFAESDRHVQIMVQQNKEQTNRLAKLEALREAIIWWDECSDGYAENGWGFWFSDDANDELTLTANKAWSELSRLLQETSGDNA